MATLVMLQGHVWESFTDKSLRDTGVYVFSQFPGGVAPAVFLFLAGVTLAFLVDSREKRGVSPWGRSLAALRRAGFLGGLAILFAFKCGCSIFLMAHGRTFFALTSSTAWVPLARCWPRWRPCAECSECAGRCSSER